MKSDTANSGPTEQELRWFGLIIFVLFAAIGGVVLWRLESWHAAQVLWSIGIAFALIYYAVRPMRRLLYAAWMRLTAPLAWAVSHLVLAIVYYGIITPIALMMRLFGRDKLERRFDAAADSYWIAHPTQESTARYFRQS
jgi:hypothetical protein